MLLIELVTSNNVDRADAMLGKVRLTQGSKKFAIASLVRYPEGPAFHEGALGTNRFTPALDRLLLCDLSRLLGRGDRNRYLLKMADTSPQSNVGTDDEKERIRSVISERGLVGAANDEKWGRLLDAMRQREGWRPSYRYKCVDGPPSDWDVEWWYHLPFPMMSVEWFDISCHQIVHRGKLIAPKVVDHSNWILKILQDAKFCYDVHDDIVRIFGYLPKSLDALNADSMRENRK